MVTEVNQLTRIRTSERERVDAPADADRGQRSTAGGAGAQRLELARGGL